MPGRKIQGFRANDRLREHDLASGQLRMVSVANF